VPDTYGESFCDAAPGAWGRVRAADASLERDVTAATLVIRSHRLGTCRLQLFLRLPSLTRPAVTVERSRALYPMYVKPITIANRLYLVATSNAYTHSARAPALTARLKSSAVSEDETGRPQLLDVPASRADTSTHPGRPPPRPCLYVNTDA
jgi:hypothetical protein